MEILFCVPTVNCHLLVFCAESDKEHLLGEPEGMERGDSKASKTIGLKCLLNGET